MAEKCVLIDYGSGNLRSAEKALIRAASDAGLQRDIVVTNDPERVCKADRVILPGVGAFADCRKGLLSIDGMKDALDEVVRVQGRPFLGICVGMQLMAAEGHEFGVHKGMHWVNSTVKPLALPPQFKVPHMGWNNLQLSTAGHEHPVVGALNSGDHVYFVHSYHMEMDAGETPLATVDYGQPITAVVGRDNVIGSQFHPEKSQTAGLKFLAAFLKWSV
ncbi:imidazole glycerol phosphate synthase subunit HisH [Temperatibacter marinus]|uniref:Imidazole glycerol phosphate synthase subunit HisH n=1 Tax=Temperatibacter marinus TaxID=1456591 RepID=A0AA52H9Z6_9PROT|nr:imidazole glycerol phosphate synthase subunit HisH [Temperatibacter marinus]WND03711.1 imidazole glycerol phosphate synthase subunit HisH [Temperatibacter marinus]